MPTYDSESEDGFDMSFASEQIMSIAKPVTICLVVTIILVRTIQMGQVDENARWKGLAYNEDENEDDSNAQKLGGALINAAIMVTLITCMTFLFVFFYKKGWMKVIYGWLIMSSVMMLAAVGAFVFLRLLTVYNAPLDMPSFFIILWNFATVGLAAIFWRAPLLLQQIYLLISSAFLATMFYALLPTWTTWVVLGAVALYDIVAVLCPKGPLRMLVETAQERPDQPLPGLLYSAGIAYIQHQLPQHPEQRCETQETQEHQEQQEEEENTDRDDDDNGDDDGNDDDGNDDNVGDEEDTLVAPPPPARSDSTRSATVINSDGSRIRAKYRYEYEYEYDEESDADDESRRSRRRHLLVDDSDDDQDGQELGMYPPVPARGHSSLQMGGDDEGGANTYQSPLERSSGRGLKLGLGDFIFYSVLVSHAAVSDMVSMFTTTVAILMGLVLTLFALGIYKRALPALPFSIALGLIFYITTELVMTPYFVSLALSGVMV